MEKDKETKEPVETTKKEAVKTEKKPVSKDVVMSGEEYADLMRRIEKVEEKANASGVKKHKRVRENTAKIKMMGDDYILGYKLNKHGTAEFTKERQEDGSYRRKITLILGDGSGETREKKVDYLDDFMHNNDIHDVPIISIDKEEVVTSQGETTVKRVQDYATVDTGAKVEQEVVSYKKVYTVELPNGNKVELDQLFLNM